MASFDTAHACVHFNPFNISSLSSPFGCQDFRHVFVVFLKRILLDDESGYLLLERLFKAVVCSSISSLVAGLPGNLTKSELK